MIALNPNLDIPALAEVYARDGLVQIPEIFSEETARYIANILETNVPWELTGLGADGQPFFHSLAELQAMPRGQLDTETRALHARAGEQFSFMYFNFRMIQTYLQNTLPGHPIHELTDFLNSAPFLDLARTISSDPSIIKADAQATLYRPGDFIGLHDDEAQQGADRSAAYTLGFTRRWRSDWGGQLAFHDDRGDITRALVPRWNTLTVFRVPRLHSVVPVSPFAVAARLSVIGWWRRDR